MISFFDVLLRNYLHAYVILYNTLSEFMLYNFLLVAMIWDYLHCGAFMFWFNLKCNQDNDLSEFDESRDIIESLVDEYKACESPDYIKWGMEVYQQLLHVGISFTYLSKFWELNVLMQDPDHILTGEGNATGTVDPKLS